MKFFIAILAALCALSVHAAPVNNQKDILNSFFENSKFTKVSEKVDALDEQIWEIATNFQKFAAKKANADIQKLHDNDIVKFVAAVGAAEGDLNKIQASASNVWEQIQSHIISSQLSEFSSLARSIKMMAIGNQYNVPIPAFHFSTSLSVARSFLEHNLVTLTFDAAKVQKMLDDGSKKTEAGDKLRDMIKIANESHDEMQKIFSEVNGAIRARETNTVLSLAQRMHAMSTFKIFKAISTAAQQRLSQM